MFLMLWPWTFSQVWTAMITCLIPFKVHHFLMKCTATDCLDSFKVTGAPCQRAVNHICSFFLWCFDKSRGRCWDKESRTQMCFDQVCWDQQTHVARWQWEISGILWARYGDILLFSLLPTSSASKSPYELFYSCSKKGLDKSKVVNENRCLEATGELHSVFRIFS